MTTLFETEFDNALASEWDTVGSGAALSPVAYKGGSSFVSTSATIAAAQAAYASKALLTNPSVVSDRFYAMVSTPSRTRFLRTFVTASGHIITIQHRGGAPGNFYLIVYDSSGTEVASQLGFVTTAAATWYRHDWSIDVSGATWTIRWTITSGANFQVYVQTDFTYAPGNGATTLVSHTVGSTLANNVTAADMTINVDSVKTTDLAADHPIGPVPRPSYMCGFEMGHLGEGVASTGSVSVISTDAATGTRCLQVVAGATNPTACNVTFQSRSAGGTLRPIFRSVRFKFRRKVLPGSGQLLAKLGQVTTSDARVWTIFASQANTGSIGLAYQTSGANGSAGGTFVAPFDEWIQVDVSIENTRVVVKVNGVESRVLTALAGNPIISASAATEGGIGVFTGLGGTPTVGTYLVDDVVFYDSVLPDEPEAYSLSLLLPAADTNIAGWRRASGTTQTGLFDMVNNVPPAGATGTADATQRINNIVNSNASPYDALCAAYSTVVSPGGSVLAVQPITNVAQAVTTGSPKAGAVAVSPKHDSLLDSYSPSGAISDLNFGQSTAIYGVYWGGFSTRLRYVDVLLRKVGNPTDGVICDAVMNITGPSTTVLATGSTVAAADIGSSLQLVRFAFSSPVVDGVYLRLRRTGSADAANYYALGTDAAGGSTAPILTGTFSSAVVYASSTTDLVFSLYGYYFPPEYSFDFGLPNGLAGSTSAAAMGTFPTGWGTHAGPIVDFPPSDLSVGPVARVAKRLATTREVDADFLGVYVMWKAAVVSGKAAPLPARRLRPILMRS